MNALQSRIADEPVTCALNAKRGRYGRALGACWFSDGENMQEWLVKTAGLWRIDDT